MKEFLAGICVGAAATVLAGIACAVLLDDGSECCADEEIAELEEEEAGEEEECPSGVPVTT